MEKQVNRTLEYGNIPFGPYVMRTKIPEDMRKRLLKDRFYTLTSGVDGLSYERGTLFV